MDRKAARERVTRTRKVGEAAREIDRTRVGLEYMVDAGVRHMGGHRSGMQCVVTDKSFSPLGHWEERVVSLAEYAHHKRIDARIREILRPQVEASWDLGALPDDHPFAA